MRLLDETGVEGSPEHQMRLAIASLLLTRANHSDPGDIFIRRIFYDHLKNLRVLASEAREYNKTIKNPEKLKFHLGPMIDWFMLAWYDYDVIQIYLAALHKYGFVANASSEPDPALANKWLKRAYELGNLDAGYESSYFGDGVEYYIYSTTIVEDVEETAEGV